MKTSIKVATIRVVLVVAAIASLMSIGIRVAYVQAYESGYEQGAKDAIAGLSAAFERCR